MAVNLLQLPDDCLLQIFENLTVAELSDGASTCSRLQSIAGRVFSSLHKSTSRVINILLWNAYNKCAKNECNITHWQAPGILRNFGGLLTNLAVTFRMGDDERFFNTFVLNLMVTYCTGAIERLQLTNCIYLQPDKVIDATAFFRNVKELVLIRSPAIAGTFLSDAQELTKLTLESLEYERIAKYLSVDYLQLRSFTLNDAMLNETVMKNFLLRHPDLTELRLIDTVISSCFGQMRDLRNIPIWISSKDNLKPIAQLDKLTAFSSRCSFEPQHELEFLETSKSAGSLEKLDLAYPRHSVHGVMRFMTAVARFAGLKYLSLFFGNVEDSLLALFYHGPVFITSDGLAGLLGHLPDLEQLCFSSGHNPGSIILKEGTFSRFCEIYRTRNQKLMIYNFDESDVRLEDRPRKEPFAEGNEQESVRFICLVPFNADPLSFQYV